MGRYVIRYWSELVPSRVYFCVSFVEVTRRRDKAKLWDKRGADERASHQPRFPSWWYECEEG
jgi:hypothetical protein